MEPLGIRYFAMERDERIRKVVIACSGSFTRTRREGAMPTRGQNRAYHRREFGRPDKRFFPPYDLSLQLSPRTTKEEI